MTGSGFEWGDTRKSQLRKNVSVTGLIGTLLVDPYKQDNPGLGTLCQVRTREDT